MKPELWKYVPTWEQYYMVSNQGRVKSLRTGNIIVGDYNNFGYRRVTFYDGNRKQRVFLHRLVMMVFRPVFNMDTLQVNHIDGNKDNNSVSNLEWVTQSENELHAIRLGLKGTYAGWYEVIYSDGTVEKYDNYVTLGRKIGISPGSVSDWVKGLSKSYKKYGILDIHRCN